MPGEKLSHIISLSAAFLLTFPFRFIWNFLIPNYFIYAKLVSGVGDRATASGLALPKGFAKQKKWKEPKSSGPTTPTSGPHLHAKNPINIVSGGNLRFRTPFPRASAPQTTSSASQSFVLAVVERACLLVGGRPPNGADLFAIAAQPSRGLR